MMFTSNDDLASELTTSVKSKQISWLYTPIIEQTLIYDVNFIYGLVLLLRVRLKVEVKNTTYMKDSRTSGVLSSVVW